MAKQCKFTNKCFDDNCYNLHSVNFCKNKDHCVDFHCRKRHSKRRPKPCAAGGDCKSKDVNCRYLHPIPYETTIHLEGKIKRDQLQDLSKKYKVHYVLIEKKKELHVSSNRGQSAVESFLDEINVGKYSKKIPVPEILDPFSTNQPLQHWLSNRIEYKFGKVNLVWKCAFLEIFATKSEKIENVIRYLNKLKKKEIGYDIPMSSDIKTSLQEELNSNFVVYIPSASQQDVYSDFIEVPEDEPVHSVNNGPKSIYIYSFSNFEKEESRKYLFQIDLILKKNYIDIKSEFIGFIKLGNKKLFGKDKIMTYNSATKDKLFISHFCTKDIKDIIEWVRNQEKELSMLKINFPSHTAVEIAKFNEVAREKLPDCYWVKDETKITCVFKKNDLQTIVDSILSVSTPSRHTMNPNPSYLYYLIRYKRFPPELDYCSRIIEIGEEITIKQSNLWVKENEIALYGSNEDIEMAIEQIEKAIFAFGSVSSMKQFEFLPEEIEKYNVAQVIKQLSSKYGVYIHLSEVKDGRIRHLVIIEGLGVMVEKASADLDALVNDQP